jgi:hypothetical protein
MTPLKLAPLSLAACLSVAAAAPAFAATTYACPDSYQVKPGLNIDFPHKGEKRAFVLVLPKDLSQPLPVWVPLTGTVESTNANLNVPRSGANARLADAGFLVIGPVRKCSEQDPDGSGPVCNGPGSDGWNWKPWREGRQGGPAGDSWKQDEGPDSSFLVAVIQCVGVKVPAGRPPLLRRRHLLRRHAHQPGAAVPIRLLGRRHADLGRVVHQRRRRRVPQLRRRAPGGRRGPGEDPPGPRRAFPAARENRADDRHHRLGRRARPVALRRRPLLGLSSDHPGRLQLLQRPEERGPHRLLGDAWAHVAAGEYRRLQPLGAHHPGLVPEGLEAVGVQADPAARRLQLPGSARFTDHYPQPAAS